MRKGTTHLKTGGMLLAVVMVFVFAAGAVSVDALKDSPLKTGAGLIMIDTLKTMGPLERPPVAFFHSRHTEALAQGLTDAGVAAVLATSQAIDDQVALEFAGHFYAGLGGGASIETAYAEAKAAVVTCRGSGVLREGAPDLYRRGVQTLPERWPWQLHLKDGATGATAWNLPEAAGDLLFGLPRLPRADLPERPYRHLQRFERAHAELFFGRGREIRALYERITDPHAAPILLLYGRSGVGKSSLLEAGLIPRLERTRQVIYRRREQALGLWGTLTKALEAEDKTAEAVQSRWHHQERQSARPLVVILDQVEEVYTRPDPKRPGELSDFLDAIQVLLGDAFHRPQGKLVLAFRKEWLSELQQALAQRELPRSPIVLEPLAQSGLIEAIKGPIRTERLQQHYGLTIEDGLPESIADTLLADPDAPLAPTLQVLLDRLWDAAKQSDSAKPDFNSALYQGLKREGLLLGDYLDQQLAAIEEKHPEAVQSGLVLDLLAYHTTARGTAEAHSREAIQQEYAHLWDRLPDLIEACQAGYLLLPAEEGGTRLSHDTLAPLIRERFEESDRPGQRARTILEGRAPDWADAKDGTPLDQADLAIVEAGSRGMRAPTADAERLLAASRAERARRQRVAKRLRLGAAVAMLLILVTAGVATLQWWRAEGALDIADRERRLAQSRQLAAQASLAGAGPAGDLVLGTLLATESLRRARTLEGYLVWTKAMSLLPRRVVRLFPGGRVTALEFSPDGDRIAAAVAASALAVSVSPVVSDAWGAGTLPEPIRISHGGSASGRALSPDGRWLAAGNKNGLIRLVDPTSGNLIRQWQHQGELVALAASAGGERLASGSRAGEVILWDLPAGSLLERVDTDLELGEIQLSPDGVHLVARSARGYEAQIWNLTTGQRVVSIDRKGGEKTVAEAFSFSPNGGLLATVARLRGIQGGGWAVRVRDVATGRPRRELRHQGWVASMSFSPDGNVLATAARLRATKDADFVIRALDLATGEEQWRSAPFEEWPKETRISPDGAYLAARADDDARIWSMSSGKQVAELAHGESVSAMAFNADGGHLATGSEDGTVRLWSIPEGTELGRLEHEGIVTSLGFREDGQLVAASVVYESNVLFSNVWGDVGLWETATGKPLMRLAHDGPARDAAWDADGGRLVTGGDDRTARVWDSTTGAEIARLEHASAVRSVAFAPDGKRLVTEYAYGDRTKGVIWDIDEASAVTRLTGPAGGVSGVYGPTAHPNGEQILTVGDKDFRLWRVPNAEELARLPKERWPYSINAQLTQLAVLAADDRSLVRITRLPSGEEQASFSHDSEVASLVQSPDGSRLIAVTKDGVVSIWDVAAETLVKRFSYSYEDLWADAKFGLPGVGPSTPDLRKPVLSPDGSRFAIWGSMGRNVHVRETVTGREVAVLRHHETLVRVMFDGDGSHVWTSTIWGRHGSHQRLWEVATGKELRCEPLTDSMLSRDRTKRLRQDQEAGWMIAEDSMTGEVLGLFAYDGRISAVAFSADGKRLATGSWDDTARVWDMHSGQQLALLPHKEDVDWVAFSGDGKHLLTASWDEHLLRSWDIATETVRHQFAHSEEGLDEVVYSNGNAVAAASIMSSVRAWDTGTGREIGSFSIDDQARSMALGPNGLRLATVYWSSGVDLWDIAGGKEYRHLLREGRATTVAFSADGKHLATGETDGAVRVWEADSGTQIGSMRHDQGVEKMRFSPDGIVLATTKEEKPRPLGVVHDLHLWDWAGSRELVRLPHPRPFEHFSFSPDSKWMATAADDQVVRLWDLGSARVERLRLQHNGYVSPAVISPDGRYLATDPWNEEPVLWDLRSGDRIAVLTHDVEIEPGGAVGETGQFGVDLAFSPDSRWVATAGWGAKTAQVWSAATGEELQRLFHGNDVRHVAFSRDGTRLLTLSRPSERFEEGTAHLWDLTNGRELLTVSTPYDVNAAMLSPDGRRLITGHGSRVDQLEKDKKPSPAAAVVWDTEHGRELFRLPVDQRVTWVAYSPDGARLLTRGYEFLQLWDAKNGSVVAELPTREQSVGSLNFQNIAFSGNGQHLITTVGNVAVLWDGRTGEKRTELLHESTVDAASFSGDGTLLATGTSAGIARVWETETGRELARVQHGDDITDVAITPDKDELMTAGIDGTVRLWPLNAAALIADACERLERNLTRDEWRAYLGNEDYRRPAHKRFLNALFQSR